MMAGRYDTRGTGWVLLSLGAGILGLGAWSVIPYLRGGCGMQAMPFLLSLPVGVPLTLGGLFVLWAADGARTAAQRDGSRRGRFGGVVVDVAAFLALTVLVPATALVLAFGDLNGQHTIQALRLGLLGLVACVAVAWAERRRLRRA